jgi:UDP-N-acetylmuramoylalanine--D-glutamate ligase
MQPCGEIAGIRFVNDAKSTTVESVRAAIHGLPGPVWLALGGRNKGLDFADLRDDVRRLQGLLVFGEAAPEIQARLAGAVPIVVVADLDELVHRALALGRPGDTLLFSPGCTSFDMFRNAEERGEAFNAAVRRAKEAGGG